MGEVTPRSAARVPIRRRVLRAVLACALVVLALAVVTSMYFMSRMTQEAEDLLAGELRHDLTREVELRARRTEALFAEYKGYMSFLRDYTEAMYGDYDRLVETGTFVDSSRATTPEGVYAMQSAFASPDYDLASHHDEMYFFSHLESVLEPLAKGHEDEISTIYLGTTSGMMISYDQWSQLSAVPEPDFFVYDYTKSDWYTTGLVAEDVFLTSLYVDSMGRGLTITIATPFHDASGKVAGVLAADFDITGIYDAMISMDVGEGSSSIAIDEDGKIISVDSDQEVLAATYLGLDKDDAARLMSGETGVIESEDAFMAYAPVSDAGWTLCAIVPRSHLMEKVARLDTSFHTAIIFFSIITVLLVVLATFVANHVTKSILLPIEQLVRDMRIIADGDLDHRARALRNDEIGDTSERLNEMVERLQGTIRELQSAQQRAEEMHALAHKDALTSVKSKAAYDAYVLDLEEELERDPVSFAVGAFDCDNLKTINDRYGHDRGDEYLKNTCRIICHVFKHSPVFRVGGDEFIVILRGDDFVQRDSLVRDFLEHQEESVANESEPWKQVRVSIGIAVYDPFADASVTETVRRADRHMYANKAKRKATPDNG